jgi:hypothetical protein
VFSNNKKAPEMGWHPNVYFIFLGEQTFAKFPIDNYPGANLMKPFRAEIYRWNIIWLNLSL